MEVIKSEKITQDKAIPWIKGLIGALIYLHSINVKLQFSLIVQIIHRDIKPANIVFKNNVPKLIDFGFAKETQPTKNGLMTIGLGTPKYMAPELLECANDYDCKVDVWALGWTFFEMVF